MADEYNADNVAAGEGVGPVSSSESIDGVDSRIADESMDIPLLGMPSSLSEPDSAAQGASAQGVSAQGNADSADSSAEIPDETFAEQTQAFDPLAEFDESDIPQSTVAQEPVVAPVDRSSQPSQSASSQFAQSQPEYGQYREPASIFPEGTYYDTAAANGLPLGSGSVHADSSSGQFEHHNMEANTQNGTGSMGSTARVEFGTQTSANGGTRTIPTADDVATVAFAPVAMSAADAAALGVGNGKSIKRGNRGAAVASKSKSSGRRSWIIAFAIIGTFIVLMAAAFFGANWYFQDRVAPGVHFGSVKVVGQTADELKTTVRQAVADSSITVTDSDGGKTDASLEDLGVTVDVDKTVAKLLNAKSDSMIARVNPFAKQNIALVTTSDEYTMSTYLTNQLVREDDRAVASTISYDGNAKAFTVQDGKDGKSPEPESVINAIKHAVSEPGAAQSVSVTYTDATMPISVDTAKAAADQANQRLNTPLVITNSKDKSFTLPADEIAKWIKPVADTQKGTITLSYDQNAIKSYLTATLPSQLDQEMVTEKTVTNSAGKVLMTLQKGVDGVNVEGADQTATDVLNALNAGSESTITAQVKVTDYTVESRKVDYESPNGDPHMVINLSEQMAYAYKGSTLVKSFTVSTGKPTTPTDNGTFLVHTKYQVQTMRGEDYVTPNVPWVTYYNQGEGFHGAPWNSEGIASGTPKSHGCTNMYVDDAKWVYDFLPIGAMVQVVGSTPDNAVR